MAELDLLRVLLLLSMAIGPLGTHRHFLFPHSRLQRTAHVCALLCAAAGLFSPAPVLCVGWLAFCALSFALFVLPARALLLRAPHLLAACVPFVFSNVAAVWLVCGANDLHLLGYGVHFSYYAALHGNVLGWILLGALAILADRDGPQRALYVASVFACLVAFLLIAFGIDQLRPLKSIGVATLSIALTVSQLTFLRSVWPGDRRAFALGAVSFAGLVFTMVLAWRNELALSVPNVEGIRGMVSLHGVLNTLVVAPCFLLAASLSKQGEPPSPLHHDRATQALPASRGPT